MTLYKTRLFGCKSCSERRDGIVLTRLVCCYHIHVTFDQYQSFSRRFFGKIQRKKIISFVKNDIIARIEIFRL